MKEYQTVLITGCSSGIGKAATLAFARAGYCVYASMRNRESAGGRELNEIAKRENLNIRVIRIDVTDNESIQTAVSSINEPIDILINNAGFGAIGPIEAFTIEEIQSQYDTNIFGMIRMVKAVVPAMRKRGNGLIINLSSINGLIPFPLWGVYSSSKYAVESISESLSFELSHFGIDVAIVEPGSFLTDFPKNKQTPNQLKQADSPYKPLTDRFLSRYDKAHQTVRKGFFKSFMKAEKIADLFLSIAREERPRLRYMIGLDAHMMYMLRKILPTSFVRFILRKVYNW